MARSKDFDLEITIDEIFKKFKLGKSKPIEERLNVIDHLKKGDAKNYELAEAMKRKTIVK